VIFMILSGVLAIFIYGALFAVAFLFLMIRVLT